MFARQSRSSAQWPCWSARPCYSAAPLLSEQRHMALRPDAVLLGVGCLIMAGTAGFVVHAGMYGSEMLDVAAPSSFPVLVLPLLLMVPCCVGFGALMLWSGFGGRFPATGAGLRCDLPPREDRDV